MKVLITGDGGQVSTALLGSRPTHCQVLALARSELDICDANAVRRTVNDFRPELILNAAAYTAVDRAESEPALAEAVNAHGARHLAEAAAAVPGCRLVHISSDYVFDGKAQEPYPPGAPTDPLNVYGRSKLAGEQAVFRTLGARSVILRTSWVFGAHGRNFLLTMLRMMKENRTVRVVADQKGAPTSAASVARALWRLAERPAIVGTLHWTDAGVASWFDFAQRIAEEASLLGLLPDAASVVPIATVDFPTPAMRPAYAVLDLRDSAHQLGLQPIPWTDSLRATLRKLARVTA